MKIKNYYNIGETVFEEKLKNGLKVIIMPKKGFSETFCFLGVKYGALTNTFIPRGEKNYQTMPHGVSHFLEHKMFSKEDGKDISSVFQELSLECNAYTTYDRTVYYFSGTKNINKGINLLLDFVNMPYFSNEDVEKEKEIITQEIMMYQDIPSSILSSRLKECLFVNNEIVNEVAGTKKSINEITKEILYKCYNTFYHPSNMTLTISGDVNPYEIIEIVKNNQKNKFFPKKRKIIIKKSKDEKYVNKKDDSFIYDISTPKAAIAFKLPKLISRKNKQLYYEIAFKLYLDLVFCETTENYQFMKENDLITPSFDYYALLNQRANYLSITTDTTKPKEFVEFIKKALAFFDITKTRKEYFEVLKRGYLADFITSFNSLEGITDSILEYEIMGESYFNCYKILNEISINDLKKIGKFIDSSLSSSCILLSEKMSK